MIYENDRNKETREAIDAGERALRSLRAAQNELNSAGRWGMFDMFGGGFLSTMMKHSKMGNAQQYMEQAKFALQNFSKELNEVNRCCSLNLEIGDFLSFADYFFDGIIADWMVQSRIDKARRQVDEAIRRTEEIVRRLRASYF